MAKDKLTDYDSTASGNLDVGGISVAEGMLPSGVNNAIRELMSHQADAFGAGTPLYVDQTNNRVGVNNAAPSTAVDVTGTVTATSFAGDGSALTNLPAAGIANVVDDTTPQLGGNLDTNGNDVTFGDNDKAIFGDGSDLQIYHDGNHSYVTDQGNGNLRLRGSNFVQVLDASGNDMIQAEAGGAVDIYHNGSSKIATTATGASVTGTLAADQIEHSTAGSLDTSYVVNGSAKAWVNFNGIGTVAVRDSLNASSISDYGVGYYGLNFSSSAANINYSISGGTNGTNNSFPTAATVSGDIRFNTRTSSPFKVQPSPSRFRMTITQDLNMGYPMDVEWANANIHGDLA